MPPASRASIAIWITREPALANEELEHRPQRPHGLKDLAIVGERVSGAEKAPLATNKTDDGASIRLQAPPSQASLAAWDLKPLIDAARVKECQAKRPRTRFSSVISGISQYCRDRSGSNA